MEVGGGGGGGGGGGRMVFSPFSFLRRLISLMVRGEWKGYYISVSPEILLIAAGSFFNC